MFRKSVSFFTLVALFWLVVWHYVPDSSPDQLSFTDFLRSILLLFSLAAFGVAVLMLIVRYKGLDLVSHFIPYGGLATWLGQQAYQYSQAKTILEIHYQGPEKKLSVSLRNGDENQSYQLHQQATRVIAINPGKSAPQMVWHSQLGQEICHVLPISLPRRKVGKNKTYRVVIEGDELILEDLTKGDGPS